MKVIKVKDYNELSKVACEIFVEEIKKNPSLTLGLATGSTPIGLYQNLIKEYEKGNISFKDVKTFNLDEYCGLERSHPQSYYTFMHENLFSKIDINLDNVHLPRTDGTDLEKLAKEYNELLLQNQIDLQVLGIGSNGHIGFNEPGTSFDQETFVVELTQKTREDNKRFFNSIDEVPTHAITMGIKNILAAKKIVLLASGKAKAEAIYKTVKEQPTPDVPASALQLHPDVTIIVDEEAGALL
ncbi:MAG TPA: glucosamine-6-phosphate deaminase [Bacilli bacterium]|nr:glucosamine-6-phosphate deaminase [Bacilli bacterium]HPT89516.1 glucosamine-6-phosphate deaminase [Bacilli bacterium]HQD92215.1 glucosamine-6-phosphate deaminase [Bacilli bacterium]